MILRNWMELSTAKHFKSCSMVVIPVIARVSTNMENLSVARARQALMTDSRVFVSLNIILCRGILFYSKELLKLFKCFMILENIWSPRESLHILSLHKCSIFPQRTKSLGPTEATTWTQFTLDTRATAILTDEARKQSGDHRSTYYLPLHQTPKMTIVLLPLSSS